MLIMTTTTNVTVTFATEAPKKEMPKPQPSPGMYPRQLTKRPTTNPSIPPRPVQTEQVQQPIQAVWEDNFPSNVEIDRAVWIRKNASRSMLTWYQPQDDNPYKYSPHWTVNGKPLYNRTTGEFKVVFHDSTKVEVRIGYVFTVTTDQTQEIVSRDTSNANLQKAGKQALASYNQNSDAILQAIDVLLNESAPEPAPSGPDLAAARAFAKALYKACEKKS